MELGTLSILNAGAGDLRVSFNKDNEKERARAQQLVTDLLRQGYAIIITDDQGGHHMVRDFDPEHAEYIVVGEPEPERGTDDGPEPAAQPESFRPRRGRPPGSGRKRVPAERATATAVAPSAGG